MPRTKLGIWSLCLIVAMPLLFLLAPVLGNLLHYGGPSGNTILEDIVNRPALAITMVVGMGCGVASFITGLVALIRQKERAFLVFASAILSGLFCLFLVAELLFEG